MNTPAINAEMAWNNRTLTGADGHNPPLPWNDRPYPVTNNPPPKPRHGSSDPADHYPPALLKDIRPIEKYGGKIQQFAAQKFLLDCDRYFEEIKLYLGEEPSEQAKVAGNYATLIETFQSFKSWIEHEFSEHLGKEKRWDYFDSLRQGARSVQAYAMELQQATFDTGYVIPEEIMIQHLRKGANVALQ
ncbi:hypothetical protein N7486_009780 [Penicillium sp. IBT 16267x]|nr:hypothetical protein N7486_009780 [Penicillium sp. IBT 16267x]